MNEDQEDAAETTIYNEVTFATLHKQSLRMQAREVMTVAYRGLMERYRAWFPEDKEIITLYEGNTPLLEAPRFAEAIGLPRGVRLWLKLESMNPTGSFKDRGMTVAVSRAKAKGGQAIICASTGNTAASAAAYAARAGMLCTVLVPAGGIAAGKFAQVSVHNAQILEIEGNFDHALQAAITLVKRRGDLHLVNSVNPDRLEGQKTAAFEICDTLGRAPDAVFLPVGNAGNISAYWRGFTQYFDKGEIDRKPVMIGVQAEGAAAMVRGEDIDHPQTAASAIRIGRPASRHLAAAAAQESGGGFTAVSDDDLIAARDLLGANEGVYVELASCAGPAALMKDPSWPQRLGIAEGNVVCVLTGHGLKDPSQAPAPRVTRTSPDIEEIERAIEQAL